MRIGKHLRKQWILVGLCAALCAAGMGCEHPAQRAAVSVAAPAAAAPPSLTGDPGHPGHTQGWVDTQLYFGLGPADDLTKGVSEAAWRDFLDKEVTPRFPEGLSVLDVYGQWQSRRAGHVERLRSKLLVIDHPDTPEDRAKINQIRSAWKQRTGDQSVLMVNEPADVSF
jgi:hypothetical protein